MWRDIFDSVGPRKGAYNHHRRWS